MNQTKVQVEGVLLSDPFPYNSFEEGQEIYLAKFCPNEPLKVLEGSHVQELFLHLGLKLPTGLTEGQRVSVVGALTERRMVTRSGKVSRSGVFQIIVEDLQPAKTE
ncbi:hypothetical protein [Tumebacillus permanentifrigoris]|jgi:hypothetical protein|uniref:Single-stranded DNA-binding protein n=1 Tax=Tumebacillus permanentifrigoris TaxID=378543 RepID=A0A316DCF5_9BACL|nr:hypothetical protein [Tumebacillus permanentifrigoris]PWK13913.1 hypothetical protein C7459_106193 [Tumebacillus permanentifrigoris]